MGWRFNFWVGLLCILASGFCAGIGDVRYALLDAALGILNLVLAALRRSGKLA